MISFSPTTGTQSKKWSAYYSLYLDRCLSRKKRIPLLDKYFAKPKIIFAMFLLLFLFVGVVHICIRNIFETSLFLDFVSQSTYDRQPATKCIYWILQSFFHSRLVVVLWWSFIISYFVSFRFVLFCFIFKSMFIILPLFIFIWFRNRFCAAHIFSSFFYFNSFECCCSDVCLFRYAIIALYAPPFIWKNIHSHTIKWIENKNWNT